MFFRLYFLLFISSIVFAGDILVHKKPYDKNISLPKVRHDAIKYINYLRKQAGLSNLRENKHLNKIAQKHSQYLSYHNALSHFQTKGFEEFTGIAPWNRAKDIYKNYWSYLEVISRGDANVFDAVDGLFNALYHRSGLLNFFEDDIGIGYTFDIKNKNKRICTVNVATKKERVSVYKI